MTSALLPLCFICLTYVLYQAILLGQCLTGPVVPSEVKNLTSKVKKQTSFPILHCVSHFCWCLQAAADAGMLYLTQDNTTAW